ncbi:MAG: glucose 1-dehydrogenase [Flavobacteriaceae bacterium]|nr:glucose 1-dehydrogenase [Flavobacteriaceae bacterium]
MILKGKVALITGTRSGIGKAIAERFAEEGAIVYANAREDNSIDSWAKAISRDFKTKVIPSYFDVTDHSTAKKKVLDIKKEQGQLDILVNNAGIVSYELLAMTSLEKLREMFEVNVVGMIHLMQIASRLMSRQKSGSIINISSIVGVQGVKGQLSYSATKGAVNALTKSAAKELASSNIRVNAIAPGMVETDRFKKVFEEKFSSRIEDIGMGRLAKPKEIANTCIFLGSNLSEYVSGQIIGVDGCTNF